MGRYWPAIPAVAILAAAAFLFSQDEQPRVVEPGGGGDPPADAVRLFDGKDLSGWRRADGGDARCKVVEHEMVCTSGDGDIYSREMFRAAQIHVEFLVPDMPEHTDQLRGNSGVYVQDCYEVQILDSWRNPTYPTGMLGAIYGLSAPLVNAARPPGQWQSYDILFRLPSCDASGAIRAAGRMTVLLNGVLVQDAVALEKGAPGCSHPNLCAPGPLRLQDHSGFPNAPLTTMKFRNIWVRHLE